jgi:hypothetical protein
LKTVDDLRMRLLLPDCLTACRSIADAGGLSLRPPICADR